MLGFYDYTVIATYASLCAAGVGIWFASEQKLAVAALCLVFAGFLDLFDGRIARTKKNRTDEEKRFGIQIDSLTDLVAFGVLPMRICEEACRDTRWWAPAVVVGVLYLLCALIRLAYFNVTEEARQDQTVAPRHEYLGLPVTTASIFVPALWLLQRRLGGALPFAHLAVLASMAVLFISPIRVKKPGQKGVAAICVLGAAAIVAFCAVCFG